jgi:methionyl-tRNA formyltransferase
VNWAVLHGETQTGATLHQMVERADAGDIIDQESVPIGPDDSTAQVQTRVTGAAVRILNRQIDALKAGTAPRRAQDISQGAYFGRRRPEDGKIDWTTSAHSIHNLVRAVTHPYPGAFTDIFGVKTYIWASRCDDRAVSHLQPGQTGFDAGKFFVTCGDNKLLEILCGQIEGEDEVDGTELGRRLSVRMPINKARSQ